MSLEGFIEDYGVELRQFLDSPLGNRNMPDLVYNMESGMYARIITTIWVVDTLKPAARSVLELMIFFDSDYIPGYPLRDRCAQMVEDPRYPRTPSAFSKASAGLLDSFLLKTVNKDDGVRIHRTLQLVVRMQLERDLNRSINANFANAVSVLDLAWSHAQLDRLRDEERWAQYKELYPHVMSLRNGYTTQFLKKRNVSRFKYARLLYQAGR